MHDAINSLPPQTAPETLSVQIRSSRFQSVELAEAFGHRLADYVRNISRIINLSRLDGITFASDYDNALLQLDRGFPTNNQLEATKNLFGEGVAMTPMVIRDGILKWHIILDERVFYSLDSYNEMDEISFQNSLRALYLLAHECGHVHDGTAFDMAFPGKLGKPYGTCREKILFDPMLTVWQEYAATRLAAPFCKDFILSGTETLVVESLKNAIGDVHAGITRYRLHGDLSRLLMESGGAAFAPIRYLGYFFGEIDGMNIDFEQCHVVFDEISLNNLYYNISLRLHSELERLWQTYGEWHSFNIFDKFQQIAFDLYDGVGIHMYPLSDGNFYISV
ncbi:hypothetical protein [uncultured Desulfovibrio sp.]|uniref:hypothetical protein n=1 Tax=uncultured Desulfovibrio sp. TaxID=167968 RepID=UPI00261533D1|nr:hypothetical protein [uncultured Desulfovibrio sp.]